MKLLLDAPPTSPAEPILVTDAGIPSAEPGRVVVRMEYGGLNRIDRLLCDGLIPRPAAPHVLGAQGSGRVVATGDGVDDVKLGEMVGLYPYGGCGSCERCESGNETLCRQARLDGVNAPGMYQSHYLALARDAFAAPPSVSAPMAALGSVVAVAWHVLVCRGGLQAGETVAISSITSGLGACCGALAGTLGTRVIGVARAGSLARLRITPPWIAETWASDGETGGGPSPRVDLAVDMVGAPTLPAVHRMVKTGGRMVTVGAHAGGHFPFDIWRLFTREQDLRGSHGAHRTDMCRAIDALQHLEESELIDSVFAIQDFAAAYERLETPGRFGNVLLDLTAGELSG